MSAPRVTHFGYGLSDTGGWVATCEAEHGVTSITFASEADARAWRCPECRPEAPADGVSLADLCALVGAHPDLGLPWTHEFCGVRGSMGDSEINGVDRDGNEIEIAVVHRETEPPWDQTAEVICAAMNALPGLLARVAAAEAERDAQRKGHGAMFARAERLAAQNAELRATLAEIVRLRENHEPWLPVARAVLAAPVPPAATGDPE